MFEQLPPQAYNCCLKGFEDLNPSPDQDILNTTTMSPQNMQMFEQLLQSKGELPPTGIFMPNPNLTYYEGKVPPYVVSLTVHVDVNEFVKTVNLMQPFNPSRLGNTTMDVRYESNVRKNRKTQKMVKPYPETFNDRTNILSLLTSQGKIRFLRICVGERRISPMIFPSDPLLEYD